MTESDIKRQICDYLNTLPSCVFTLTPRGRRGLQSSKYCQPGWPDITGFIKTTVQAIPLFIEVKKPGGAISKPQHDFILRAHLMGALAFIAENVDDVQKALSSLSHRAVRKVTS